MEIFLITYFGLLGYLIFQKNPIKYLIAKIILSALYLALAFFINNPGSQPSLIQLGLGCCFIGDVILGYYHIHNRKIIFLMGLGAFFVAHIVFGLYLNRMVAINGFVILSVFVTIGTILLIKRIKLIDYQRMDLAIIGYGIAISIMASLAIFNHLELMSQSSLLLMLGAILFFVSDLFIIFKYFYQKKYLSVKIVNLSTYYLAVLLISLSLRG